MRIIVSGLLLILLVLTGLPASAADTTADGHGQVLHVGIFPRRPAKISQRMFAPLADYLSRKLGTRVQLHTPPDFVSFWRAVEAETFDIVHYNQYHYVRARHQLGHRLLARNREQGSDQIRTAIIVRRESRFQAIADLKGRKIIFGGGRDAMVSYIMAIDLLRTAGLNAGDFLADFAQNPPKAAIAMYYGQADAAAAGEPILRAPVVTDAIGANALRAIATSDAQPQLPWAVSRRVAEPVRERLIELMLDLDRSAEGRKLLRTMRMDAYSPATDADYDSLRDMVERVLDEHY
jgi:phosphonate transport system substrate-binding protein